MSDPSTRRRFLKLGATALGTAAAVRPLSAAQTAPSETPVEQPTVRPAVGVCRGEDRRKIVADALCAVEDQILPVLRTRKHVVIKPNIVNPVLQLATTHADTLAGVMDFLAPRWKGSVMVAESSAAHTQNGYEQFGYRRLTTEWKSHSLELIDLNEDGRFVIHQILDNDLHLQPVRLAARLLDPEAFIINATPMKTHNAVVATLSVKNMTLGAPLRSTPKESSRWSDKRRFHVGLRQMHLNILMTAQRMRPNWGATVIDGYEGMEGNGPNSGSPVPSRVAIASADFVAADRVGVEIMGIDPSWVGYLNYCGEAGVGEFDLARIEVRGERIETVRRPYQLHRDVERMLDWRGPMKELPYAMG
jgi:uncharacterized protein (DUF362 family)